MTKVRSQAVLTLLVVAVLVLPATGASAHVWSDWYGARWATGTVGGVNNDRTVQWKFVDDFPAGVNGRDAGRAGASTWNGRTTMDFDFESGEWENLSWGECSTDYQNDKVGWEEISGSGYSAGEPLAQASLCTWSSDASVLKSFKIRVNSDVSWYTSSGTSVPSNQLDLESTMAHEFGHATGRSQGGDGSGHFVQTGIYCDSSTMSYYHTMCNAISGTYGRRSLEEHDIDTFEDAY